MEERRSEPDVSVILKPDDVVLVETGEDSEPAVPAPAATATAPHPCVELTAGLARYLLAILDLSEGDSGPSQSALSRRLGVSAPTTSEAIGRLRDLGLVERDAIALTVAGTSAALVLRSRRLAAHELAHEVLGLDPSSAEEEAERIAFSASPRLGRSLVAWRAGRH